MDLLKINWSDPADLDLVWVAYKKLIFKLLGFAKNFVISIVYYMFLAWVFLSIYGEYGFEKTLIILLIGVFYVRIKRDYYGRTTGDISKKSD